MVYSHLIYCVEVWGNAAEIHLNSLLKVQKKVIKNIKSLPYRAPSRPVFKDLNILTITQIHQYHILIFVFKYLKDMLPITFHNFYKLNRSVIYRETRVPIISLLSLPKPHSMESLFVYGELDYGMKDVLNLKQNAAFIHLRRC